jgi:DNA-binding NarL/FixJ family response regulator
VVLAEEYQILRQGVKALLRSETDLHVVGEASTGVEALRAVERFQPAVLVLNLTIPEPNGLEVTQRVARISPRTRVVILSRSADEGDAAAAVGAGASGYLGKEASAANLIQAIRAAAGGRRYLSPPFSEQALAAHSRKVATAPLDPLSLLTPREREVLRLTAEGSSGVEVAERLFISPRTVETHRANVMRKLALRNQRELVRFAVEQGILRSTR